jgi:hypothetical protein
MRQYLLSVMQPEGETPAPEILEPIMAAVDAVNAEMRAAGVWVFSGGLTSVESATVLRADGGTVTPTDGPYLEGKEYLGGLTIINAPDLDEALRWGAKVAAATTLPIEVRAFAWS